MIDTYIIKNSFDAMTEKTKIAIQKIQSENVQKAVYKALELNL